MTTIVVKKEREGCKIFPLKRQKNTDQGELVPPGIRFFSRKGGRVPLIYIKPPHLGGDYLATAYRPAQISPLQKISAAVRSRAMYTAMPQAAGTELRTVPV